MKTMTAAEAKQKFGQLMDAAQRGPVAITKHGQTSCYVLSSEDYKAREEEKRFYMYQMLRRGLEDVKEGRTYGLDEVKAEMFKLFERDSAA